MQGEGIEDIRWALDQVRDEVGHVIECGSARCGTTILMAQYLKGSKKIFACDTFGGFNKAELEQEQKQGLTTVDASAFTHNSPNYVAKKIRRLGYEGIIEPIKGYFEDTLDSLMSYHFCLALIDCDLQKSMTFAAEKIWP